MRNSRTENSSAQKSDKMMLLLLFILFLLLSFTLINWYSLDHMKTNVNNMRSDMEYLKQQKPSSSSIEQTEYLKAIEFMENETEKYRDFVQQQQQFIISLLGLIGTGLAAFITFWGLNSRKDISNIIHNEYKTQINNEIAQFIGGQDKVQYLAESIQKEETARSKKILFLLQQNPDESLKLICHSLRTQGYCADKRTVSGILTDTDIRSILNDCNLVIYQVSPSEFANAECPDSDLNFKKIAAECNNQNIFCVLYCTGRIKTELCDLSFYVNTANYGSTALERIHNILYYIQE